MIGGSFKGDLLYKDARMWFLLDINVTLVFVWIMWLHILEMKVRYSTF